MRQTTLANQRATQWRERITQQAKSGQSIAAWCREHGIAVQTFYWWKSRLHPSKKAPAASLSTAGTAPFIDLGTLGSEPCAGLQIRLDLGNGMTLSITRR
jgi:transposase-like protein